MTSTMITDSPEPNRNPLRTGADNHRFFGVVIASLLLHGIGFGLLLTHGEWRASDPPRLIMVEMTTMAPPEPGEAAVPRPVPARPRLQPSSATSLPLSSRPALQAVVTAPPVPVAVIGESKPASRGVMAVPVAAPVSRRLPESAPAAPMAVHSAALSTPPADGAEKLAKARASYRATIALLIDRNKEYPLFSRKAGQQGSCSVRCSMTCDGTITKVELVRSSGYTPLDKAGLRAVSSVGKFPPPPHDGGCSELFFEVPITFRLS